MAALVGGEVIARHVVIHLLEREVSAHRRRLGDGSILISVDIAVVAGREHHIVAVLNSLACQVGLSPHHHSGIGGETGGYHLVPSHKASAVGIEEIAEVGDEMCLQSCLVGMQLFHHALAEQTVVPGFHHCLVASHMDIFRREYVHHLKEHVLKEIVCCHTAGTHVGILVWLMRA